MSSETSPLHSYRVAEDFFTEQLDLIRRAREHLIAAGATKENDHDTARDR